MRQRGLAVTGVSRESIKGPFARGARNRLGGPRGYGRLSNADPSHQRCPASGDRPVGCVPVHSAESACLNANTSGLLTARRMEPVRLDVISNVISMDLVRRGLFQSQAFQLRASPWAVR